MAVCVLCVLCVCVCACVRSVRIPCACVRVVMVVVVVGRPYDVTQANYGDKGTPPFSHRMGLFPATLSQYGVV